MKTIFIFCYAIIFTTGIHAQGMKDPSTWTFHVGPCAGEAGEKKTGNLVSLRFDVLLQPGWHVYALNPGGDGTLIAPSFVFAGNRQHSEFVETGEIKEIVMEGVDGKVRYHEGKAGFSTCTSAKHGDIVKGSYTYQLCSESMCLPPKTRPFSFRIP